MGLRNGAAARRTPGARDGRVEARGKVHRTRARLCFAAVLAWWLVQGVLLGTGVGEPYPSVLMPRFARAAGYHDGAVYLERMAAAFVSADTVTVVSQRTFFEPIPDSRHGVLATLLKPQPEPSTPLREWLRSHGLRGLRPSRSIADPCVDPSLQRWLGGRAAAIGHPQPPTGVEIRWFGETVRPSASAPPRRQPLRVVHLPLHHEAACAP